MRDWLKNHSVSVIVLVVLSSLITFSHSLYGVAISMDSLTYINIAQSIAEGNGIVTQNYSSMDKSFEPVTMWPPLYPAILSTLCLIGSCSVSFFQTNAVYFNLIMLVATSVLILVISLKFCHKWMALAVSAVIILMPTTQIVFTYLWSEVVFIPLIFSAYLLFSIYLERQHKTGKSEYKLLLSSFLLLACATYARLIGVSIAIAAIISILVVGNFSLRKKIELSLISGFFYSGLVLPLLVRNYTLSGSLSGGERGVPEFRVYEDLNTLFQLLIRELFLNEVLLFFSWGILFVVVVLCCRYRKILFSTGEYGNNDKLYLYVYVALPLIWMLSYVIFLLISRSTQHIDLDARMLSVVLPFFILTLIAVSVFLSKYLPRYFALSPALLVFLLVYYDGLITHQLILKNLQEEKSIGSIHGVKYSSITETKYDFFRDLAKTFYLDKGRVLLTDIDRPQGLAFFFENARVKSIPVSNGNIDFKTIDAVSRGGLAILATKSIQELFIDKYKNRMPIISISAGDRKMAFLVIKFPP